ncbi:MAG: tRNA epoxyqueuosine(34) reductase QueG [Stellaceae bacterium]
MEINSSDLKIAIRDAALRLGFDAVGFARAELSAAARAHLADYLSQGFHGDMGWLEARAQQRGDPRELWPEAKTVVVLAMNYGPEDDPLESLAARERGTVSVYARGRDYHDLIKSRLKALARQIEKIAPGELKLFVDTAPVMEKPLAHQAGIGWQGKHTNLVSRAHGSWLFLGEIYLSRELPPDVGETDHCGQCQACLDICPTRAFVKPYVLDARRCISYLTIEHKGHIDAALRPLMGNRIYGCDDCLAACPWNKFAHEARENALKPRGELASPPRLADLAALDDASFRKMFSGSPVKRTGRDRFVRNVLIAIGNSGDAALAASAESLLGDASPLVRAMAVWALGRLMAKTRFAQLRTQYLPREADDAVRTEWNRLRSGTSPPTVSY